MFIFDKTWDCHNHMHSFFFSWEVDCLYSFSTILSEIWDALRAAAEAEIGLAQAIVDSAGVIVQNQDLTICYDERGPYSIALSFCTMTPADFSKISHELTRIIKMTLWFIKQKHPAL